MTDKGLGEIVDLDQTKFEEMTKDLNLGDTKSLILVLENTYNLLRTQKDAIVYLVTSGKREKNDPQVNFALKGIYAELTKIELKVTHLKTRAADLTKTWRNTVDTDV